MVFFLYMKFYFKFLKNSNFKFFDYSYSILIMQAGFLFVLLNLGGLFPFTFSLTSHLFLSLYLSFSYMTGITLMGFFLYGLELFNIFLPKGTPSTITSLMVNVEFISYMASIFSLSMRLFANMMSGHILFKMLIKFMMDSILFSGLINLLMIFFVQLLILLDFGMALLQGYIFVSLSLLYLKDILYLKENH